jgi:hypothetical protein
MGTEKKQRHEHRHDHHDGSMAASTDIADVTGYDASADNASKHQRKGGDKPYDERWGEGAAVDASGRILGIQIHNVDGKQMTQIMIGIGQPQGVRQGMEGYVMDVNNHIHHFWITNVHDRVSYANVDATPDSLHGAHAVVNPTSMPKSTETKQDMNARILGVSIENGMTRIILGTGDHARAGMKGYIVGFGGKPYEHFEVTEVRSGAAIAYVHANIDTLHQFDHAIVNPSSEGGAVDKGPAPGGGGGGASHAHAGGHAG